MARVTAIRAESADRTAVELDGVPWRVLPTAVVARTGVCEGRELDRETLRDVRRELRRYEALALAARALRRSELSRETVATKLQAAGSAPAARRAALETLERLGLVDDVRVAAARAETLAARGYGDAAIVADLARRGVADGPAARAVQALAPEADRAALVAARRGMSPKTAAYLARRGFGEEAIETALAPGVAPEG